MMRPVSMPASTTKTVQPVTLTPYASVSRTACAPGNAGSSAGCVLMKRSPKRARNAAPTSFMKPAETTRSGWYESTRSASPTSQAARSSSLPSGWTKVGTPAARARSSPYAPALSEPTATISASRIPAATASSTVCSSVPDPDSRTTTLKGRGFGTALAYRRGLLARTSTRRGLGAVDAAVRAARRGDPLRTAGARQQADHEPRGHPRDPQQRARHDEQLEGARPHSDEAGHAEVAPRDDSHDRHREPSDDPGKPTDQRGLVEPRAPPRRARFDETSLIGGLSGVVAGLAVTVVAVVSRGNLGMSRLVGMGPRPFELFVMSCSLLGSSDPSVWSSCCPDRARCYRPCSTP